MSAYFVASVLILAAILFIPVSRLIWVFSTRRLENKLHRTATKEEVTFQRKRANLLTIPVVIIFSYLFCLSIGLTPYTISL